MSWTVVNSVFKGRLGCDLNLQSIHSLFPGSTLQYTRPTQLIIKYDKLTIILFTKGAVRVMGNVDEDYAYLMMALTCEKFTSEIPDLELQTMTVLVTLSAEQINLYKLHKLIPSTYEFELFPGLRIIKYNPLCVNVFSTGKMLICGLKTFEKMYIIINELTQIIHNTNVFTHK